MDDGGWRDAPLALEEARGKVGKSIASTLQAGACRQPTVWSCGLRMMSVLSTVSSPRATRFQHSQSIRRAWIVAGPL